MDAMTTFEPLEEVDINANTAQELVLPIEKKNRNVWTEKHRLALVNQTYLDDCCPIGKRTHKEVGAAWRNLVVALQSHRDGLFDGFDLSVEAIRRQLRTMMNLQRQRNEDARQATGLGGAILHSDLEAGIQNLIDLQHCMKEERAAEREGKTSKLARLDEHAKDALRRSMETHTKRSRVSRSERSSGGPKRRRSSGLDFDEKMALVTDFARVAMEEFVERNARLEWLREMKLHATHPMLADHPGPKDEWVELAIKTHQKKMANVANSNEVHAPQVSSESDEVEPRVDM